MEVDKSVSTSVEQQQQQADEKQSELIEGHCLVISSQPTPVQPPIAVVETAWRPTILVVDDSAMNRKVKNTWEKQHHPLSLSPSLTSSLHRSPFPRNVSVFALALSDSTSIFFSYT